MKKVFIYAMAFIMMSCTGSSCMDDENVMKETQVEYSEEYKTMYLFVDELVSSELWEGLTMPENPTLDDLMRISEDAMNTDIFGDTIGEGDCEQVYRTMLAYYLTYKPDDEFTQYLLFIVDHEMY
jgi:hypothetical protein